MTTGQPGLSLMVQCLNPEQPPELRLWGLQALSFQARQASDQDYWAGPWPKGMVPETTRAEDLVRLLTAADVETNPSQKATPVRQDPAKVLVQMPTLCCVEVPGLDQRRWMVQGIFDFASQTLTQLMVLRVGEWVLPQTQPA